MRVTIRQLRDYLETFLAGFLGSYTLSNGTVTPAVAVRADSEGLPAGTKVSGLEMVINRHPGLDPVRQYFMEECQRTYEVWLLAWSADAQIREAAASIVIAYPGTTVEVITLPEGWGPKRQMKLTLLEPQDMPFDQLDVDGGNFRYGIARARVAAILDGGNFFDGSTLNTFAGSGDGGLFV